LEIISPKLEILPDAKVTDNVRNEETICFVIPQAIRKSDIPLNNFTSQ